MKKLLKVLGSVVFILIIVVVAGLCYINMALPNVGKAPAMVVEKTPERVKHGEYLANHVAVCIDCHSTRDYSTFSAPLVLGTEGQGGEKFTKEFGFPGTFVAPNITPYHLEGWTDGELYRAITTGVNKEGRALFPLMPWEYYGKMDAEDVKDIIAYLRTLPSIKTEPPVSKADFPVNFILNTMPHPATPTARPAREDKVAYGAYLVNAAGCVECHSERKDGKLIGKLFAGGFEFHFPDGSVLRSPNITPDPETGIGNWSEAAFVTRFKSMSNTAQGKVQPGQMQTVMPWTMYGGMDTTDLKAIYAYLHSLAPVNSPVARWTKGS